MRKVKLQPKKPVATLEKGTVTESLKGTPTAKLERKMKVVSNYPKMETKSSSSMRVSPSANMPKEIIQDRINAAAKKGGIFKKKG
jgi:hypothetical protein